MTQQRYEHKDPRPDLPFHEEPSVWGDRVVVIAAVIAIGFLLIEALFT